MTGHAFPFAAIVGQDEMRRALLLSAIDPAIGGVLAFGDRGTGKTTAIRGLAALLPPIETVARCRYQCAPGDDAASCPDCSVSTAPRRTVTGPPAVVDLPLGVTEDRVVGALDLERALVDGVQTFEPGLLARAHRGFLYIDEINLLEDHLVDLLLDVCASGVNIVERDGLSIRHRARFVLIGSGNPEEGDLRPQLLDRFGLAIEARTSTDLATRVEVLDRRLAFDDDPAGYCERWMAETVRIRERLIAARERLAAIATPHGTKERAVALCLALGTDGLRGELTLLRAARAAAAWAGGDEVSLSHLREIAMPALRHRLRRDPLDEAGADARVRRAIDELLPA